MEKSLVSINNENLEVNDVRISSRDVAQMLDIKEHSKMLKKIDTISKSLTEANFGLSEYWIKTFYQDSSGKKNREYAISKKGCELIAHKTTGDKGVLFTLKYMEKFEQMEKALTELNPPSYMIDDPIQRAKKWIEEQQEKNKLELDNKVKEEQLEALEPVKEYHDKVLLSPNLITSTDIAKDLGISPISLHKLLNQKGILFRRNKEDKTWKFYHKYQHMIPEYADYHISGHSQHLKWTEKGRKFIIDLVENDNEAKALLEEYRTIYTNPKKRKKKKTA